jgi:hypothetical protein
VENKFTKESLTGLLYTQAARILRNYGLTYGGEAKGASVKIYYHDMNQSVTLTVDGYGDSQGDKVVSVEIRQKQ